MKLPRTRAARSSSRLRASSSAFLRLASTSRRLRSSSARCRACVHEGQHQAWVR